MKKVTDSEYGQWKRFSHDLDQRILSGSLNIKDLKRATAPLIGQKPRDGRFDPPLKEFEFTVPKDYVHGTQLERFGRKTKGLKTTHHYNNSLTDENFSKVSHKLIPGKTYTVKFIPIKSSATSEECLDMYARHNAVLVGAQGLTLLQETHPDEFPVEKYSLSFDDEGNLPVVDGDRGVPGMGRYSDGDWDFRLGYFGNDWRSDSLLCVFCEKDI